MSFIKRKRQIPAANVDHQMPEYNEPIISQPTVSRQARTSTAAPSLAKTETLDQDVPVENPSKSVVWLQFWASAAPIPSKGFNRPVDEPTMTARELDTDEGLTTPDAWPRPWIYDQDHRKAGFSWKAPLVVAKGEPEELFLLSQSGSNNSVDGYSELNTDGWDDYRDCMINVRNAYQVATRVCGANHCRTNARNRLECSLKR